MAGKVKNSAGSSCLCAEASNTKDCGRLQTGVEKGASEAIAAEC